MNDNNDADDPSRMDLAADADELQRQRDDFYDRLLRKTASSTISSASADRQSMSEALPDVARPLRSSTTSRAEG
jgi:hypothetical protein